MNIRCFRCGWSFSISRETAAAELASLGTDETRTHTIQCPRCRHALKIPVEQLRRAIPPGWKPAEPAAPQPAAPVVEPEPASAPQPEPAAKRTRRRTPAKAREKPE